MAELKQEINAIKQRYSIVGNSEALFKAISQALLVAPYGDLSVLIIGENGTGKEFFPKIIHERSRRKGKYIAVNCAAIPEGIIESELFGHVKGAFTSAVSDREGYFATAKDGTIFLDEVAELPMSMQAKLLRVLESGEFMKMGSSVVEKTNARVVAATNKDLIMEIKEGRFREDLYHRISTIQINVPPLRNRGNDIGLLAYTFASHFAEEYNSEPVSFDAGAKSVMDSYNWPGNVRQLRNVVNRISVYEAGKIVDAETMKQYLSYYGDTSVVLSPKSNDSDSFTEQFALVLGKISQMQKEIDELRTVVMGGGSMHTPQHLIAPPTSATTDSHTVDHQPSHPYYEHPQRYGKEVEEVRAEEVGNDMPHGSMHSDNSYNDVGIAEEVEPTLEELNHDYIVKILDRYGNNRRKAAQVLGISERTLYRKIDEYGLRND